MTNLLAEERSLVYENVRIAGIRTFDQYNEFISRFIRDYLEIEAVNNTRMLLSTFGVRLSCEPGAQPIFKVPRHRRHSPDD